MHVLVISYSFCCNKRAHFLVKIRSDQRSQVIFIKKCVLEWTQKLFHWIRSNAEVMWLGRNHIFGTLAVSKNHFIGFIWGNVTRKESQVFVFPFQKPFHWNRMEIEVMWLGRNPIVGTPSPKTWLHSPSSNIKSYPSVFCCQEIIFE